MMHAGIMGKLIMLILLLFSLASWSVIFMKFFTYRRARNASMDFLDAFWESKTLNDAYAAAREFALSPEAAVFVSGYAELKKISQRASDTNT
jgi:biopolymer transport protein TolQ